MATEDRIAGMEYIKPECPGCGCFEDLPCGPCAAIKGECTACSDDTTGADCELAHMEAVFVAHRKALGDLVAGLDEVIARVLALAKDVPGLARARRVLASSDPGALLKWEPAKGGELE